jgi:hypothetical protein
MSTPDDIQPPRAEVKKLPRVTCPLCRITQAKPAMQANGRCRNEIACQIRRDRNAARNARGGK